MPGPMPKSSATRQRKNRSATIASFESDEVPMEAPEIGPHPLGDEVEWHPRTVEFWRELWDSPMRDEYLRADLDGLRQLTALIDRFWKLPDAKVAAEIRLQRQCFGLTPIDRRRLQWEIVRVENAQRKPKRPTRAEPEDDEDPRAALRVS